MNSLTRALILLVIVSVPLKAGPWGRYAEEKRETHGLMSEEEVEQRERARYSTDPSWNSQRGQQSKGVSPLIYYMKKTHHVMEWHQM